MPLQLPSVDEISAHMAGTKLTTIIFFLDETFEEVSGNNSSRHKHNSSRSNYNSISSCGCGCPC